MTREEVEKNLTKYFDYEDFERYSFKYIAALKEQRLMCKIHSVSQTGMSRTMSFHSLEKPEDETRYYLNFYGGFFEALGYKGLKGKDYFRVHGCGMDMVFATNYNVISYLRDLGFVKDEELADLQQARIHVL